MIRCAISEAKTHAAPVDQLHGRAAALHARGGPCCARRALARASSLTLAALLAAGCVSEPTPRGRPALTDSSRRGPAQPDTSVLETYVPRGLTTSTSAFSAAIGPLGSIEYDGLLMPLVSPAGTYLAVQDGRPAPTWDVLLASPAGDAPPPMHITIYRIEKVQDGPRQQVVEHLRLDEAGVLGRSADEHGFLVESPQSDGSRRIGWAEWTTGRLTWLLRSGVNAFATRSGNGRLAWCERISADPVRFDLFVQGPDEVFRADDDGGSWLFPVWSADNTTLFAFHLKAGGELDLAVFDTRSAASMRRPIQRERITGQGSVYGAYQALAGIQSPAAPDASPRMLFYHSGQDRIFEYDAWPAEGRRVRGLPAPSIAAAWHHGEGIVYSSRSALHYQFLREGSSPVELLKGAGGVRLTSNPMHPFILIAVDRSAAFRLNLWAMDLVDEATVRAAAERLDPSMADRARRR